MTIWHHLKRPPWRTLLLLLSILGALALAYLAWCPGKRVHDGSHDLQSNGIWLQHGWLGDDPWFARNRRDKSTFRDPEKIRQLAGILSSHGMKYIFPHLCPCAPNGFIPPVDPEQTERFLDGLSRFKILPWIGGVTDVQCLPESPQWRSNFVASTVALLQAHPRLAGVHVNIEPMPSGNSDYLLLLEELRRAIPEGKMISVAAYPPPTRWHRFPDVHWDEPYFRQVAQHADQLAVMMYDTAIRGPKVYQHLMSLWTKEILTWAPRCEILLGVPAYDDAGVGYHNPKVENLENALLGVHAGLARFSVLPSNYRGIAVYCEWEMDDKEWLFLKEEFEKRP